jgi:putative intracellular protease/amidase
MQRGLEDRRIALFAAGEGGSVARVLEQHGARVAMLNGGIATRDEDWHGGRYAALVIVDAAQSASAREPRLAQLVREFLVSDKPVAVYGGGVQVLHEAGGVESDVLLAASDSELGAFTEQLVAKLASQLEERQLDDMSDQSFPASDPPATSPGTVGRPKVQRNADTRPH